MKYCTRRGESVRDLLSGNQSDAVLLTVGTQENHTIYLCLCMSMLMCNTCHCHVRLHPQRSFSRSMSLAHIVRRPLSVCICRTYAEPLSPSTIGKQIDTRYRLLKSSLRGSLLTCATCRAGFSTSSVDARWLLPAGSYNFLIY